MELWENSFGYSFGRVYVDACTRSMFGRYTVRGRENIPSDGAVIFASNHCNTLMDALVILHEHRGPISFGARFDIFRNPKVASVLDWLKLVPLARNRDGAGALKGNQAVFDRITDCLLHGAPFCIFPEGTHRAKRSLLPLKWGVCHIAVQTVQRSEVPVYIVPVGLDYVDYFDSARGVTVSFGKALCVNEFMASHPDPDGPVFTRDMLDELSRRLSSLITFFPDDENYDAAFAAWDKARRGKRSFGGALVRLLGGVALLPLLAVCSVLGSPVWLPSEIVVGDMKDKVWSNTVRYGFRLVLTPLLVLVSAVLSFVFLPWWAALGCIAAVCFAPRWFYLLLVYYKSIFRAI